MIIDENERERNRARLEAEKSQKEEDFRRQEAEKRELEELKKQRRELLEWLVPFDYNSKHQASTQLRQEGTCGWLLENATFKDWLSGSGTSPFLWLYGIRTCSVCMWLPSSNCMMQPVAVKRHYCKNPLISQN